MQDGERVSVKYYVKDLVSGWVRGPFPKDRLQEKASKLETDRAANGHATNIVFYKETVTIVGEISDRVPQ